VFYTFAGISAIVIVLERSGHGVRYVWKRLHRPPPRQPDVVLGHPSARIQLSTLPGDRHRKLVAAGPTYLIENKDVSRIRDVRTGVRTRDGRRDHVFDAFLATLMPRRDAQTVTNVGSIPADMLDGVHESVAGHAFFYWARFEHEGVRWEVVYDPETRSHAYSPISA
jgi:hypothetical protein